jgi:alpha/beta superfamily hydrolase
MSQVLTPSAELLIPMQPSGAEEIGYLSHNGVELYFVRHRARGRQRCKALLAGPFAIERQLSYTTWVRWARALASAGFEVLRFDYRGTGESTGRFDTSCMSDWKQDLLACLDLLRDGKDAPTLLIGVRMGALLAAEAFEMGEGDGLLLWDPPATGQVALHETLRRKLASDMLEVPNGTRRTRADYVAQLTAGAQVEVEGYMWSRRLWMDSAKHSLTIPDEKERRPWKILRLSGGPRKATPSQHTLAVPVPMPPFWWHGPAVVAEVSTLFQRSLAIASEFAESVGGSP